MVRIEDTDKERDSADFTKDILDGLKWLGLQWDEGPEVGGPFEPYFQQERLPTYEKFADQLIEQKLAYRCFCTKEELEAERQAQKAKGQPPKYSGRCRHLSAQEIDQFQREGRNFAIRFVVEPQSVSYDDLIKGKLEFDASLFGDFVIVRSNGTPLFVFTNVIDDHLMGISHVLRGEDHVTNTAKQLLIAQALNILSPQFGHFPLIFNADHSKMSKRKDPVSVTEDFRNIGYLPEAMVNFMALLGWSSGTDKEVYTMHELIGEFQIERVGRSPSIFDPEKLLWMNGYYIRHAAVGDIAERLRSFIVDEKLLTGINKDPDYYLQVVASVQDRLKTLAEIEPLINFFYIKPDYDAKLLIAKKSDKDKTVLALKTAQTVLDGLKIFSLDETEIALRHAAKEAGLKDGELLWAVRVSLTGKDASPGAFEVLEILGKTESLARLASASKKLASSS